MNKREKILEDIISKLDITPTMYKNAKEKYETMAAFLKEQGIECDIYPQGSFRTGTVTRPFRDGVDSDYDLDMVCQLNFNKSSTTARQVKWIVGSPLKESKLYSDKDIKEYDRCWTLKYAKVDSDVGFLMDVVPSVLEETVVIENVVKAGVDRRFAAEAISITNKLDNGTYLWAQSNPQGYAIWFDEINAPFLQYSSEFSRKHLYEENRSLFASVEDVPQQLERSSLQRVVQILKRHRDIYYTRANRWNKKPISAIITTLVAQISRNAPSNISVYELLQLVTTEMYTYSALLNEEQSVFESKNFTRIFVRKDGAKWSIRNPINPNDNYTEDWQKEDAEYFFRWAKAVKIDFIDSIDASEEKYFSGLESGFGKSTIDRLVPKPKSVAPAIQVSQTKPWGIV